MSRWEDSYIPYCYLYVNERSGWQKWVAHAPYYGRCLNCGRTLDDVLAHLEGIENMPRLSDVMSGADATWGEQYDKGSLRGMPFWIHNAHATQYENPDEKARAIQPMVEIIVLDITLTGPSTRDPHAVITVGNSPERAPMLAYFNNPNGSREPLGPCHTFEVPLKGGRSFWRIEDYDADIMDALNTESQFQFDSNGKPVLPAGK